MHVCIRRGSQEIGGSCVEVKAAGHRLVLDCGLPLDAGFAEPTLLPGVSGLDGRDPTLAGLVVTHGHPDHWGLVPRISPDVPLYVGEVTARVLRQAMFFTPMGADLRPSGFLRDGREIQIGPFHVTPRLVDHSAFDAYAIEVEARGKRLLYSGDLRGHGRRRELLTDLFQNVGRPVDVLLLEGTNVRPEAATPPTMVSEQDVEDRCTELFTNTKGLVLAAYSPQNVDRMITLYRAARAAGRKLVLDLYAASIAAAVEDPEVPRWDSEDVLIYVPQAQRVKVKRSAEFERVKQLSDRRIFGEDLAGRSGELVLTFRASMIAELQRAACLEGAAVVWSMWAGYLDSSGRDVLRFCEEASLPLSPLHASGHASLGDLQRLVAALRPDRVVPIHTAAPDRFGEYFENVERRHDGEWWEA